MRAWMCHCFLGGKPEVIVTAHGPGLPSEQVMTDVAADGGRLVCGEEDVSEMDDWACGNPLRAARYRQWRAEHGPHGGFPDRSHLPG